MRKPFDYDDFVKRAMIAGHTRSQAEFLAGEFQRLYLILEEQEKRAA